MKQLIVFFIIGVIALCSPGASAQTNYITDNVEIMMRSGPSSKNKIIKILESGDRVTIINNDVGNGHSEVKSSSGAIGYVLTRYLSETPSARNQVKRLQSQLNQLRAKPGELQALLANAQDDNQALIAQNTSLTAKLKNITEELDNIKRVSSDAVNIANKNSKLETEVQQLLLQLDDIRIQNKSLKDQSEQQWFMLGVGAIVLGLFLGWLLSKRSGSRRQSWGS
ncbi:MAG: TIGR04211 family SH3 domain-containing protein [Gammaproteobacteria bacterium]|nr:TIGR04211 family SH3 domain-containing protein [Gammaproteobacteria bacterium]